MSMNVLSKILDKTASTKKIGYHPLCKNVGLTHLSFADDILDFTDAKIRSVEGIIRVFDDFAKISGLKISMEKSIIYLAGIDDRRRIDIEECFLFTVGNLPVRYLGLPLTTKRMKSTDYLPLLEKIRSKISC